jgi:hypothetical protein
VYHVIFSPGFYSFYLGRSSSFKKFIGIREWNDIITFFMESTEEIDIPVYGIPA